MKKFLTIIIMSMLLLPNIVKAETIQIPIENQNSNPLTNEQKTWITQTIPEILQNRENYVVNIEDGELIIWGYNTNDINGVNYDIQNGVFVSLNVRNIGWCLYANRNTEQECSYSTTGTGDIPIIWEYTENEVSYTLYDSNRNIVNSNADLELLDFYNDNIVINQGDDFPLLKNLYQYNSWSEYESNYSGDYEEVNLDNYKYVLLTLKDYNQNKAFSTNLQVKGSIGITPIYNYGQSSKEEITGVKVQDRCNVEYQNYTAYPFYIINQDLQNNVVYAVKSCKEGSKFKYDREIFNISYVTSENESNPTVIINGKTYDVIPFDDLPSSANKNEEENYIPGESGNAVDTGGLDGAIKGAKNVLGQIWDTFTYFTGLVNMLFSAMPVELRTILVSAFTITITLGLIKIFLN